MVSSNSSYWISRLALLPEMPNLPPPLCGVDLAFFSAHKAPTLMLYALPAWGRSFPVHGMSLEVPEEVYAYRHREQMGSCYLHLQDTRYGLLPLDALLRRCYNDL